MSQLEKRIVVGCPLSQAPVYLDRFFAERADSKGQLALTLRAPIEIPGLSAELRVERIVTVTIERALGRGNGRPLNVRWSSAAGGPFPTFCGTLEIEADEEYTSSRLALVGSYDPPFGAAGKAFDAMLGRRIALATARDLLGRLAEYIEQCYEETESQKAVLRERVKAQ